MRDRLRRPLLLVTLYGAMSVAFCLPLFERPDGLGVRDWDQHLFYYGSVLKSVVGYGQLPFWNPWYCGGNVLWQNPQVGLLSPVYPLTAVMSLQLAMKVNIVLHYWVGFMGMHLLLTRGVGLTFVPLVVYLATLVTASGALALHLAAGHSVFLPVFYLPLQLFLVLRAFRTRAVRDALAAGAIVALAVINGGVHVLPMAFASVTVLGTAAAIATRRWTPLLVAVVVVASALAYAAPKLLPVTLFVTGDRFWDTRSVVRDAVTLDMLPRIYLDSDQHAGLRVEGRHYDWHEYGNYIGLPGVVGLLAGLLWALWSGGRPDRWLGRSLAVTALFLLALSVGEVRPWAPASLMTHLPLFSSFRVPSRYTIVFLLFGVATFGWALRALEVERRGRLFKGILTAVCLAAALHVMAVNRTHLGGVFTEEPFDTTFRWRSGTHAVSTDAESNPYTRGSPMLRALVNDRLFFYCYESLQLFRTAVPDRDVVYTEGESRLLETSFTPNRIEFAVAGGREPSRVFLNYNWGPGWTSTAGPIDATSREVMGFVALEPGQTGRYAFSFVPPGVVTGAAVFAGMMIVTAWAWRLRFRGTP